MSRKAKRQLTAMGMIIGFGIIIAGLMIVAMITGAGILFSGNGSTERILCLVIASIAGFGVLGLGELIRCLVTVHFR